MDVAKILEIVKLPSRIYFVVAVATGIVLFASDSFLQQLGLFALKSRYLPWLGGAFLLTTLLFLSNPIAYFGDILRTRLMVFIVLRSDKKKLSSLEADERAVLRLFI